MMRAYFASPYRSHTAWPNRIRPVNDAIEAMFRLRMPPAGLEMVISPLDVKKFHNVVWSPLVYGSHIGNLMAAKGVPEEQIEREMLAWCCGHLRQSGFDTIILSEVIPRKPGYGANGMDVEREIAGEIGLQVYTDVELVHA